MRPFTCVISGSLDAHLELRGRFELVELGFWSDCFLEALQEDPLELHDLLDVAEKCVDLSVAQEGLFLHGFQVVLQQAVQMLVLVGMEERKKRTNWELIMHWIKKQKEETHTIELRFYYFSSPYEMHIGRQNFTCEIALR